MLAHSCTIFPCYLGMDNQCKDPINKNKDCRFGQLTTTMSTSLGQEKCPPGEDAGPARNSPKGKDPTNTSALGGSSAGIS